jgi:hypothetical protein
VGDNDGVDGDRNRVDEVGDNDGDDGNRGAGGSGVDDVDAKRFFKKILLYLDPKYYRSMRSVFLGRFPFKLKDNADFELVVLQEIDRCRRGITDVSGKLSNMVFEDDVPGGMIVVAALDAARDSIKKRLDETHAKLSDPNSVATDITKYYALVANTFSSYAQSILKTITSRGSSKLQTMLPPIKTLSSLIDKLCYLVIELLLDGPVVDNLTGLVDRICKLFIIEYLIKVNISAVRGIFHASLNDHVQHISALFDIAFSDSGGHFDIDYLHTESRILIRESVLSNIDDIVPEIQAFTNVLVDENGSHTEILLNYKKSKRFTKKQRESITASSDSLAQRIDKEMHPSAGLRRSPRKLLQLVAEYYYLSVSVDVEYIVNLKEQIADDLWETLFSIGKTCLGSSKEIKTQVENFGETRLEEVWELKTKALIYTLKLRALRMAAKTCEVCLSNEDIEQIKTMVLSAKDLQDAKSLIDKRDEVENFYKSLKERQDRGGLKFIALLKKFHQRAI